MKILYVSNAWLSGGAEEHMIELAHSLLESGVQLMFAVSKQSDFAQRLQQEGLPHVACFAKKKEKIRGALRLSRLIVAEQPDVISVNREHNIYLAWIATKLVAPILKIQPKLVMVFHTPTGRRYPLLRMFDGIVATSHYTAQSFANANPAIFKKTSVIHYGINLPPVPDESRWNPDRAGRFFRQRGFPVIGMVGELWKNQEELVPVVKRLLPEFPNLTMVVVGGNGNTGFDRLRSRISEAGLVDHFQLVPRIPRTQINNLFQDFDLSVSTHRNEGFGIVHVESLAAGTPVVAYRAGGLIEIIENGGGRLIDGECDELADSIASLLRNHTQRIELGHEGLAVVERLFSRAIMASKHYSYYSNMIGR